MAARVCESEAIGGMADRSLTLRVWFREGLKKPLEKPGKDRKLVGFGLEPDAEDWIAD